MSDDKKGHDGQVQGEGPVHGEMAESELHQISGGAFPTAVNSQITDAVTVKHRVLGADIVNPQITDAITQ